MDFFKLRDEFYALAYQPSINLESAKRCLEIIKLIAVEGDDEVAHGMEDALRDAVLRSIDHPLASIALQTSDIQFCRWCA